MKQQSRQEVFKVNSGGQVLEVAATLRCASKDLLLLLPGLACVRDLYRHVWRQPGFQDVSILAIDFIGFGASSKPDEFSYAMEDQARVCGEMLKVFRDYRLHVVAHSMGAAVGLLLADSILAGVHSFASVEGNLTGDDCGAMSRRTLRASPENFEKLYFPFFRDQLRNDAPCCMDLEQTTPLAFYKSAGSLVAWSDSGELLRKFKSLECTTTYFYGERNAGMSVLDRLDKIPKLVIGESGHFMMMENPDEFYAKLLATLPMCPRDQSAIS